MIFAVDFDGTLCKHEFPGIGEPRMRLICQLKQLRHLGHKLILWTCREGVYLEDAVEWCRSYGLCFDTANDNLYQSIVEMKGNTRKVFAHYYIDDRVLDARGIAVDAFLDSVIRQGETDG